MATSSLFSPLSSPFRASFYSDIGLDSGLGSFEGGGEGNRAPSASDSSARAVVSSSSLESSPSLEKGEGRRIKRFFFLRHGETDWNRDHKLQGHTGGTLLPLSSNFVQNVYAFAQEHPPHRIYVSPAERAKSTLQKLGIADFLPKEYRHLYPREVSDLIEIDFGIYNGQKISTLPHEVWENYRQNPFSIRFEGGECVLDVMARVYSFFYREQLMSLEFNPAEKVSVPFVSAYPKLNKNQSESLDEDKENIYLIGHEVVNKVAIALLLGQSSWLRGMQPIPSPASPSSLPESSVPISEEMSLPSLSGLSEAQARELISSWQEYLPFFQQSLQKYWRLHQPHSVMYQVESTLLLTRLFDSVTTFPLVHFQYSF